MKNLNVFDQTIELLNEHEKLVNEYLDIVADAETDSTDETETETNEV